MSRVDVRRHVVAYDVPSDARRNRIAKAIGKFGDRIQYSVFVVDAAPATMVRLRTQLEDLMVASEDSILICDLGRLGPARDARFAYLGQSRPITDEASFIV